jgi:hypothetical protein
MIILNKQASDLLATFFRSFPSLIISDPSFSVSNDKVLITLKILNGPSFPYPNNPKGKGSNRDSSDSDSLPYSFPYSLPYLEENLSYLYGKAVELRIIRLRSPLLNSSIFNRYLFYKLHSSTLLLTIKSIIRSRFRFAAIARVSSKGKDSPISLPSHYIDHLKNKSISGFSIKVTGRLSKNTAMSRSSKKVIQYGTFQYDKPYYLINPLYNSLPFIHRMRTSGPMIRNYHPNHIDFSKLICKNRNGSFAIHSTFSTL